MIRVGKIIEDGKIDGENSHRGTGNANGGNDPMDRREGRPSKPKQPNGQEGTLDASEIESSFWS